MKIHVQMFNFNKYFLFHCSEFLKDQNSSCNSSNSSFPKNNKTAMATAHLLVGLQNPSNGYGK